MKQLRFTLRFSLSNLHKNRRLFVPHILSGCGLIAVYYIMLALKCDERLRQVRGGSVIPEIIGFGSGVLALLCVILIFYTNSFLMKQRKKEYGLYSVLGMEKRHIRYILFWENFLPAAAATAAGLGLGLLLYKICTLLICNIMKVDSILGFYYISSPALLQTAVFFAGIYLAAFLFNCLQIWHLKEVELLRSSQAGEKEPGIKWFFLVVGIASTGTGYWIALTTKSPLAAINLLFVAVFLVMIGTYCLFLAGTIAVLKLLKKKRGYYYKANHMTAVSGLLYRMKQNAVGLASICILATGVLIMLSTTFSLYVGIDDTVQTRYPHDLEAGGYYETTDDRDTGAELVPLLEEAIRKTADECGLTITQAQTQTYLAFAFLHENGNQLSLWDMADKDDGFFAPAGNVVMITEQEYERLTGQSLALEENEMAYQWLTREPGFSVGEELVVETEAYRLVQELSDFPVSTDADQVVDTLGVVVKDEKILDHFYEMQKEAYGDRASAMSHDLMIDFADDMEIYAPYGQKFSDVVNATVKSAFEEAPDADGGCSASYELKAEGYESLYGMIGSLLFLGILLGTVFLFATAVIIYYKQVSEGYEDRERYQIMQKVGMSQQEVRRSIQNQILLVFFLPVCTAVVHMAVAFPILYKMLQIFLLPNKGLFVGSTLVCVLAFAAVYTLIYRITARTYYKIVK